MRVLLLMGLLLAGCSRPALLAVAPSGFVGQPVKVLNEKAPGSVVDLAPYLGKSSNYVLVEYFATWCGPCQNFLPVLNQLPSRFSNLTVYRIDIDKWKSPVCQQDDINEVPYFVVYAPDGKLLARDQAARDWLQAQLDQLSR